MTTDAQFYVDVLVREINPTIRVWLVEYDIASCCIYRLTPAKELSPKTRIEAGEPGVSLAELRRSLPHVAAMNVWRRGFSIVTEDSHKVDWRAIESVANVQLATLLGRTLIVRHEKRRWWKFGRMHKSRHQAFIRPHINITGSAIEIPAAFYRLMDPQEKTPLDAQHGSVRKEVRRRLSQRET